MARPTGAAAFALLLAGAAGCVYSPGGSCDGTADCGADERCDAGVCVSEKRTQAGVDPTSFTSVTWAQLLGASNATFAVDSVGADLPGNVVVSGAVDAAFDFAPSAVAAGAFVVKRASADGAACWAVSFPTFSHGQLQSALLPRGTVFMTAVLPDGDVFFAGTAFEPTAIGTAAFVPPARGALVFGRLDLNGNPLWARSVDDTHLTSPLVPAAVTVNGTGDLLLAGAGSGQFGCPSGDTAGETFAAALSGTDGSCLWSRGFGTRTISDIEPSGATSVAVAGVCTPAGAPFDPGGATTCTKGLFVAVLSGGNGATASLRTTGGAGSVSAVHDLAIAPDGRTTVVGNASGVVDFGGGGIEFGRTEASFAATFDASGVTTVVRPVEAPYAADPDALAFSRCAYDPSGRLWIAGRYVGQPTLGGIRFSACRRPDCLAASFLARLEASGSVTSFLPILAAPDADGGGAYVDDLALFATTGTVAHALRFIGVPSVGGKTWSSAAEGLGVLRVEP